MYSCKNHHPCCRSSTSFAVLCEHGLGQCRLGGRAAWELSRSLPPRLIRGTTADPVAKLYPGSRPHGAAIISNLTSGNCTGPPPTRRGEVLPGGRR